MRPAKPITRESRARCWAHTLVRAARRDIELTPTRLGAIEDLIATLRPAFELPGNGRERFDVIYDTSIGAVMTVLKRGPR